MARIHITGDDMDMVGELSAALAARGVTVVDSVDSPPGSTDTAVIELHASRFNRAALTTDARGRANAYQIRFEVSFSVAGAGEVKPSTARDFTLRRVLDYDPTRQLQSEAETRFLESAMRREAATRILQFLSHR